jgi:hypothetical protein
MFPVGLQGGETTMTVLADIATGNTNWADVFFLVAVIVFFLVALTHFLGRTIDYGWNLLAVGLGFVALGLLVL